MNNRREQLIQHLEGGMAFLPVDKFIRDIPFEKTGMRVSGLPYSLWELLVHMTYAQRDIFDFMVDPEYEAPDWPADYWPENAAPADRKAWEEMAEMFFRDREMLADLLRDESTDLDGPVINDPRKTVLREILLVIEHNAYHAGQMVVILRLLGLHS